MGQISFDLNFWTVSFSLIATIISVVSFAMNRQKAASSDITKINERLARIEADIENSVNKEDIAAIYNRVNDIDSLVNNINGQLEQITKNIDRLLNIALKE